MPIYKKPLYSGDFPFILCVTAYMTTLILALITSVKIQQVNLFGGHFLIPAGVIAFALSFLFTDIVSELWGRSRAVAMVWTALICRLGVWAYFAMSVNDPWFLSSPPFWTEEKQAAFSFVILGSVKITIWGIVTFLVAAFIDIQIYHYFREKGRLIRSAPKWTWRWFQGTLFFRNNMSTLVAQILNTVMFILLVFGGERTVSQLLDLILVTILAKVIIALLDTPFLYLAKKALTGEWEGIISIGQNSDKD